MKKLFVAVAFTGLILSANAQNKKTDCEKEELKGKVKNVETIEYKAVDKFGEIVKENQYKKYLIKFDNNGRIIEKIDDFYSSHYKYDEKGNMIETIYYEGEGQIPKYITERTIEYYE
jgi:hypothetical protein